ncbi:MAG: FAD-dependent oxidoreductase [Candidatus Latescibacteria bacterium]|nr:FAD-dependent oxidoreductase [Candidatus Latescibacterota bacterium]
MTRPVDIAIIGGGIWGLSAAYHLAQAGAGRIVVFERNREMAQETTPRAAGLIGQIRSNPVMLGAVQYALDLLEQFAAQTGQDPGLRRTGSLMVGLTDERMAAFARQIERAQQLGLEADFVDAAEMTRLAPGLKTDGIAGGYFVAGDGYVDPGQCARAYGAAAQALGAEMALGTAVTGIGVEAGQVVGVETEAGLVEAGQVLIAAGPWGGLLAQRIGFNPAVQTIRHQRVRTVPVADIPAHHPVVRVPDMSCYMRPEGGGYLYGFFEPEASAVDMAQLPPGFTTADIEPPVAVMAEAQRRLAPHFPLLAELAVAQRFQGITTFAPDGAYALGPVPGIEGLFLASGCAALGIAGSAAIGRWLAGWMQSGDPGEDLAQFGLERFGEGADRAWVARQSEQFYGSYYSIQAGE